jgi:multimeric flavodoxin WrbA
MVERKVTILDGARAGDEDLPPLLDILIDELSYGGAEVQAYKLRQIKLSHCIGCFGCWLETPGICVEADAGREIAQAIICSDMTVLFTPVTFGGYSSELKKIMDRWIPLVLPYFGRYHGEIHHTPRYSGVQRHPNSEEAHIFRLVVGRNAINFHAPTHAAEVVLATDDPDTLRQRFKGLLSRTDPRPLGVAVTSRMPVPDSSIPSPEADSAGRALLIVGSPKIKHPSTSGVLGGYVLERLKERGWETESLTLKRSLGLEKGQVELLSALDRADLILLAFPLYIDALPFLVTKSLEIIAAQGHPRPNGRRKRLFVVCNNGFPEATQSTLALGICHRFAVETGMTWSGGLAMGAGEALSSGQPLTAASSTGRPPVKHVIQALDIASAALADSRSVPREAIPLIAKNPIPFVPFGLWRWIFVKSGIRFWQRRAAENGVTKEKMLDRPYAEYGIGDAG